MNDQQQYLIEVLVEPQKLLEKYKDNNGEDPGQEDIESIIFDECACLQDSANARKSCYKNSVTDS